MLRRHIVKQAVIPRGIYGFTKEDFKGLVKKELIFFLIRIPYHAHQDKEKSLSSKHAKTLFLFVESNLEHTICHLTH